METIFINSKDSKANKAHRFRLSLSDKLNLKDLSKNMALANLSIYYTWKTLNQHIITINLKFLLQFGMMILICLMDHILLQTSKITFNLLSKNTKL